MAVRNEIYFYRASGKYGPFSNWYMDKQKFHIDTLDQDFVCAEQAIMYAKSMLFNDLAIATRIMKTDSPTNHKKLGRLVHNFDQTIWSQNIDKIAYEVLYAKFTSDENLKTLLLSTGNALIAEASPTDKIWGIGISVSDASNGVRPNGTNLLGKTLMQVRDDLLKE